jgi:hypothetical protein
MLSRPHFLVIPMRNAALFTLACALLGFGLANQNTLAEPVGGLLLARYPGVTSVGLSALNDPAGLGWLGGGVLLAAALTALAAPRLLQTESLSDRSVRVVAFCGSLVASIALGAVVFGCATSQPASAPAHDAAQALTHAGQCLRVAVLFAQAVVAATIALLRNHVARDLPPSTYSIHGYAALSR